MADFQRARLLRLLKVPPEPQPSEDTVCVFRAAPRYLQYRRILWAVGQLGVVAGLLAGGVALNLFIPELKGVLVTEIAWVVEGLAWLGFFVQFPFSFFMAQLDYELRWYTLSDRSLHIREGVVTLREKTMTFANIQQISIRQNPLQRLLGIADVKVETAGGGRSGDSEEGSGLGEHMHEAHFRGVSNAEEIRDVILAFVRRHRDTGLGEPSPEEEPESHQAPAPVLKAAKELLGEMRELRHAL